MGLKGKKQEMKMDRKCEMEKENAKSKAREWDQKDKNTRGTIGEIEQLWKTKEKKRETG